MLFFVFYFGQNSPKVNADSDGPTIVSAHAPDLTHIVITFSKNINSSTVQSNDFTFYNFIINPNIQSIAVSNATVTMTLSTDCYGLNDPEPGGDFAIGVGVSQDRIYDTDGDGNQTSSAAILDQIPPYIIQEYYFTDQIGFDDVDGSGGYSAGDKIIVTFSERMDTSTITTANVASRLGLSGGGVESA